MQNRPQMLLEVPAHPSPSARPAKTSSHSAVISWSLKVGSKTELRCTKGHMAAESLIESVSFLQTTFWFRLGGYVLTWTNLEELILVGSGSIHFLPVGNYHLWSCCASLARRPPSKAPSNAASNTVAARTHGNAISCLCSPNTGAAWGCVWVSREEESEETPLSPRNTRILCHVKSNGCSTIN